MKVTVLKGSNNVYTSNAYIVTGDWKRIEDINTLIDVGSDPSDYRQPAGYCNWHRETQG